ncbi:transcription repressor OFP3 [Selaginella moellendorffii]|nr:transcription repressor OFP3 [Selaginella moellendorffii]|eukprot:XP_002982310.2 transcription repressor OFP3 [Selaginella moellendorffii]
MKRTHFSFSRMARSWSSKDLSPKSTAMDQPGEKLSAKTGELLDAKKIEEQLARATVPIEARIADVEKMWDLEFSSMSSYGSRDLDVCALKSRLEISGFDCCDATTIAPSAGIESSCSEIEQGDPEIAHWDQESGQACTKQEEDHSKAEYLAKITRQRRRNHSLSAALPPDLRGPASNAIPLVMESCDPYNDFRVSMEQMVRENGIFEWPELQELLYCYIALNSPDQHESIKLAFADLVAELHLEDDDFFFDCL